MLLIGLTGSMGSGKSTAANIIVDYYGGKIVPFAKPLKDIAYQMGWNGKKDKKGRRLLQLLGTECGRECIGEDVWCEMWIKYINENIPPQTCIVADDVRYANEANLIRFLDGKVIRINRPGHEPSEHASERRLAKRLIDIEINNNGDIKELRDKILEAINKWTS